MYEVVRATPGEVAEIAALLTRAFVLDPVALDLFPPDRRRDARLKRFFALQLRHTYFPRGEVLTLEDRGAVALVIWPNAPRLSALHQLLALQQLSLLRGRAAAAQSMARVIAASHPREAHAYLGTIATAPEYQRQGRGSRLIRSILTRSDALGLHCCLEASTLENVRFYERFGFVNTSTIATHRGGPLLYAMRRAPNQLAK